VSMKEIAETAQAIALSTKLSPTESSIYERMCREYSKLFFTELTKVHELPMEFVFNQIYANSFDKWDEEERLNDIFDVIGSLSNPDYDAQKERALREEMQRILEEENKRVEEKRAIHPALEKDKTKFVKQEEKPIENLIPKELPKSGGVNMALIRQLQNDETESGDF